MRQQVTAPADSYDLVPAGSPADWYNLDQLRAAKFRQWKRLDPKPWFVAYRAGSQPSPGPCP